MKYVTLIIVLTTLYACSPRLPAPRRIDWGSVPAETSRPPKTTENERAFARERSRMYAALQFERQRPTASGTTQ